MLENPHEVEIAQWRSWPQTSRKIFNSVYSHMVEYPQYYVHPQSEPVPAAHWKTTAWNAAWQAASEFRDILESSRISGPHEGASTHVYIPLVAEGDTPLVEDHYED